MLSLASHRDGDFPDFSGLNPVKDGANILNPWLDERPPVRPKNDQCEATASDILLVWHVPVRSNHNAIPCFFRPAQQFAIDKRCPPVLFSHVNIVADEVTAKLPWRIVVKQYSHARPWRPWHQGLALRIPEPPAPLLRLPRRTIR